MNNIDVLNLEWPSNERDSFAIAPIILALRDSGYKCITGDIFSSLYYFCKYRPKVLLITSYQGALINHKVCQQAAKLGIKVVSLIAEGNVCEHYIEQMTWGNNSTREVYFEKMLVWSKRSQKLILKYFPELKGRVKVSGGVSFDRYKILSFKSKEEFIDERKIEKKFESIVGLAGWGFDTIHETEFFQKNKEQLLEGMKPGQLELHRKDFRLLTEYYYELIIKNPSVLFILRPHPGLTDYQYDEFKKAKDLSNVYYSKPRICNYSISDIIAICDLWGGYETTTCMEAWLLGKQTFLFNPSGTDFNREITAGGSVIFEDFDELEKSINDVKGFVRRISQDERLISSREDIVRDIIGYDDGGNYLRAISEIIPILNNSKNPCYSHLNVLDEVGLCGLVKYMFKNINFINSMRGLRKLDQNQLERLIKIFRCTPAFSASHKKKDDS